MPSTAGTRLREARLARGLSQVALARQAGISASYLNLIEHDRRRIAGRLLRDLARLLDLDPAVLRDGAGGALVQRVTSAAAQAGAPVAQAGVLAARFPDWAGLIAQQADRIDLLETRVAALTDRLGHDPAMAQALHDVISAVTSIRSTASILMESDGLDADWQARFHGNLHQDAIRLTARAAALMSGLEAPGHPASASPFDEAESFLIDTGPNRPQLETGGDIDARIDGLIGGLTAPARSIARQRLAVYAADARALPLEPFAAAARAEDYAPVALALRLGAPVEQILRRLATLPEGAGHPGFGLTVIDGAGAVVQRQPLDDVVLSRGGAGCPLWPVFGALNRPGQVIETPLSLPFENAPRVLATALAVPRVWPGMGSAVLMESTMLLRRVAAGPDPVPVGPGCRVCPRAECPARREPSFLEPAQP